MFARHSKIVQLLLLHCVVVRCYILYDIGSTPRKTATDAKDHSQTVTRRRLPVDEPAPSAKEIFRTRLESQSPLAAKESDDGGPKDREINTAGDVLHRDIKWPEWGSGSGGNWNPSYVRVAQAQVAGITGNRGRPFKDRGFLHVLGSLSVMLFGPGKYHDNLDTLPSEEGPVPFKCDCFKSPLRLWGCIKSINESIMTFIVPGLNDWTNRLEPEIRRIQKQRSAETVTVLDDTTPVSAESTDRSTVSPIATSPDDYYETVENHGKIHNVSNDRADNDGPSIREIRLVHDEIEHKMLKLNDTAKIQYNEVKIDSGYSKVVDWSRNKTLAT